MLSRTQHTLCALCTQMSSRHARMGEARVAHLPSLPLQMRWHRPGHRIRSRLLQALLLGGKCVTGRQLHLRSLLCMLPAMLLLLVELLVS